MAVEFNKLLESVGLSELSNLSREEIAADFMVAAVTGLADGDIVAIHDQYSGTKAELYGEGRYDEGRVARVIGRAAIENGLERTPIYEFQSFAAEYFSEPKSPFAQKNTPSSVRIYPNTLTVDDNPIEIPRVPSLVIDYAACLTSRSLTADQVSFVRYGNAPFAYVPLTRTHFVNQAIMHSYDIRHGAGTARLMIENKRYIGREDGIAAATTEMIRSQLSHATSAEVADIILSVGAQHTTADQLEKGMKNAWALLKEDGLIIIRGLARPAENEIGEAQMTGWAVEAGFSDTNALRYETDLTQLGGLLLSGHFGEREIRTTVIRKQ